MTSIKPHDAVRQPVSTEVANAQAVAEQAPASSPQPTAGASDTFLLDQRPFAAMSGTASYALSPLTSTVATSTSLTLPERADLPTEALVMDALHLLNEAARKGDTLAFTQQVVVLSGFVQAIWRAAEFAPESQTELALAVAEISARADRSATALSAFQRRSERDALAVELEQLCQLDPKIQRDFLAKLDKGSLRRALDKTGVSPDAFLLYAATGKASHELAAALNAPYGSGPAFEVGKEASELRLRLAMARRQTIAAAIDATKDPQVITALKLQLTQQTTVCDEAYRHLDGMRDQRARALVPQAREALSAELDPVTALLAGGEADRAEATRLLAEMFVAQEHSAKGDVQGTLRAGLLAEMLGSLRAQDALRARDELFASPQTQALHVPPSLQRATEGATVEALVAQDAPVEGLLDFADKRLPKARDGLAATAVTRALVLDGRTSIERLMFGAPSLTVSGARSAADYASDCVAQYELTSALVTRGALIGSPSEAELSQLLMLRALSNNAFIGIAEMLGTQKESRASIASLEHAQNKTLLAQTGLADALAFAKIVPPFLRQRSVASLEADLLELKDQRSKLNEHDVTIRARSDQANAMVQVLWRSGLLRNQGETVRLVASGGVGNTGQQILGAIMRSSSPNLTKAEYIALANQQTAALVSGVADLDEREQRADLQYLDVLGQHLVDAQIDAHELGGQIDQQAKEVERLGRAQARGVAHKIAKEQHIALTEKRIERMALVAELEAQIALVNEPSVGSLDVELLLTDSIAALTQFELDAGWPPKTVDLSSPLTLAMASTDATLVDLKSQLAETYGVHGKAQGARGALESASPELERLLVLTQIGVSSDKAAQREHAAQYERLLVGSVTRLAAGSRVAFDNLLAFGDPTDPTSDAEAALGLLAIGKDVPVFTAGALKDLKLTESAEQLLSVAGAAEARLLAIRDAFAQMLQASASVHEQQAASLTSLGTNLEAHVRASADAAVSDAIGWTHRLFGGDNLEEQMVQVHGVAAQATYLASQASNKASAERELADAVLGQLTAEQVFLLAYAGHYGGAQSERLLSALKQRGLPEEVGETAMQAISGVRAELVATPQVLSFDAYLSPSTVMRPLSTTDQVSALYAAHHGAMKSLANLNTEWVFALNFGADFAFQFGAMKAVSLGGGFLLNLTKSGQAVFSALEATNASMGFRGLTFQWEMTKGTAQVMLVSPAIQWGTEQLIDAAGLDKHGDFAKGLRSFTSAVGQGFRLGPKPSIGKLSTAVWEIGGEAVMESLSVALGETVGGIAERFFDARKRARGNKWMVATLDPNKLVAARQQVVLDVQTSFKEAGAALERAVDPLGAKQLEPHAFNLLNVVLTAANAGVPVDKQAARAIADFVLSSDSAVTRPIAEAIMASSASPALTTTLLAQAATDPVLNAVIDPSSPEALRDMQVRGVRVAAYISALNTHVLPAPVNKRLLDWRAQDAARAAAFDSVLAALPAELAVHVETCLSAATHPDNVVETLLALGQITVPDTTLRLLLSSAALGRYENDRPGDSLVKPYELRRAALAIASLPASERAQFEAMVAEQTSLRSQALLVQALAARADGNGALSEKALRKAFVSPGTLRDLAMTLAAAQNDAEIAQAVAVSPHQVTENGSYVGGLVQSFVNSCGPVTRRIIEAMHDPALALRLKGSAAAQKNKEASAFSAADRKGALVPKVHDAAADEAMQHYGDVLNALQDQGSLSDAETLVHLQGSQRDAQALIGDAQFGPVLRNAYDAMAGHSPALTSVYSFEHFVTTLTTSTLPHTFDGQLQSDVGIETSADFFAPPGLSARTLAAADLAREGGVFLESLRRFGPAPISLSWGGAHDTGHILYVEYDASHDMLVISEVTARVQGDGAYAVAIPASTFLANPSAAISAHLYDGKTAQLESVVVYSEAAPAKGEPLNTALQNEADAAAAKHPQLAEAIEATKPSGNSAVALLLGLLGSAGTMARSALRALSKDNSYLRPLAEVALQNRAIQGGGVAARETTALNASDASSLNLVAGFAALEAKLGRGEAWQRFKTLYNSPNRSLEQKAWLLSAYNMSSATGALLADLLELRPELSLKELSTPSRLERLLRDAGHKEAPWHRRLFDGLFGGSTASPKQLSDALVALNKLSPIEQGTVALALGKLTTLREQTLLLRLVAERAGIFAHGTAASREAATQALVFAAEMIASQDFTPSETSRFFASVVREDVHPMVGRLVRMAEPSERLRAIATSLTQPSLGERLWHAYRACVDDRSLWRTPAPENVKQKPNQIRGAGTQQRAFASDDNVFVPDNLALQVLEAGIAKLWQGRFEPKSPFSKFMLSVGDVLPRIAKAFAQGELSLGLVDLSQDWSHAVPLAKFNQAWHAEQTKNAALPLLKHSQLEPLLNSDGRSSDVFTFTDASGKKYYLKPVGPRNEFDARTEVWVSQLTSAAGADYAPPTKLVRIRMKDNSIVVASAQEQVPAGFVNGHRYTFNQVYENPRFDAAVATHEILNFVLSNGEDRNQGNVWFEERTGRILNIDNAHAGRLLVDLATGYRFANEIPTTMSSSDRELLVKLCDEAFIERSVGANLAPDERKLITLRAQALLAHLDAKVAPPSAAKQHPPTTSKLIKTALEVWSAMEIGAIITRLKLPANARQLARDMARALEAGDLDLQPQSLGLFRELRHDPAIVAHQQQWLTEQLADTELREIAADDLTLVTGPNAGSSDVFTHSDPKTGQVLYIKLHDAARNDVMASLLSEALGADYAPKTILVRIRDANGVVRLASAQAHVPAGFIQAEELRLETVLSDPRYAASVETMCMLNYVFANGEDRTERNVWVNPETGELINIDNSRAFQTASDYEAPFRIANRIPTTLSIKDKTMLSWLADETFVSRALGEHAHKDEIKLVVLRARALIAYMENPVNAPAATRYGAVDLPVETQTIPEVPVVPAPAPINDAAILPADRKALLDSIDSQGELADPKSVRALIDARLPELRTRDPLRVATIESLMEKIARTPSADAKRDHGPALLRLLNALDAGDPSTLTELALRYELGIENAPHVLPSLTPQARAKLAELLPSTQDYLFRLHDAYGESPAALTQIMADIDEFTKNTIDAGDLASRLYMACQHSGEVQQANAVRMISHLRANVAKDTPIWFHPNTGEIMFRRKDGVLAVIDETRHAPRDLSAAELLDFGSDLPPGTPAGALVAPFLERQLRALHQSYKLLGIACHLPLEQGRDNFFGVARLVFLPSERTHIGLLATVAYEQSMMVDFDPALAYSLSAGAVFTAATKLDGAKGRENPQQLAKITISENDAVSMRIGTLARHEIDHALQYLRRVSSAHQGDASATELAIALGVWARAAGDRAALPGFEKDSIYSKEHGVEELHTYSGDERERTAPLLNAIMASAGNVLAAKDATAAATLVHALNEYGNTVPSSFAREISRGHVETTGRLLAVGDQAAHFSATDFALVVGELRIQGNTNRESLHVSLNNDFSLEISSRDANKLTQLLQRYELAMNKKDFATARELLVDIERTLRELHGSVVLPRLRRLNELAKQYAAGLAEVDTLRGQLVGLRSELAQATTSERQQALAARIGRIATRLDTLSLALAKLGTGANVTSDLAAAPPQHATAGLVAGTLHAIVSDPSQVISALTGAAPEARVELLAKLFERPLLEIDGHRLRAFPQSPGDSLWTAPDGTKYRVKVIRGSEPKKAVSSLAALRAKELLLEPEAIGHRVATINNRPGDYAIVTPVLPAPSTASVSLDSIHEAFTRVERTNELGLVDTGEGFEVATSHVHGAISEQVLRHVAPLWAQTKGNGLVGERFRASYTLEIATGLSSKVATKFFVRSPPDEVVEVHLYPHPQHDGGGRLVRVRAQANGDFTVDTFLLNAERELVLEQEEHFQKGLRTTIKLSESAGADLLLAELTRHPNASVRELGSSIKALPSILQAAWLRIVTESAQRIADDPSFGLALFRSLSSGSVFAVVNFVLYHKLDVASLRSLLPAGTKRTAADLTTAEWEALALARDAAKAAAAVPAAAPIAAARVEDTPTASTQTTDIDLDPLLRSLDTAERATVVQITSLMAKHPKLAPAGRDLLLAILEAPAPQQALLLRLLHEWRIEPTKLEALAIATRHASALLSRDDEYRSIETALELGGTRMLPLLVEQWTKLETLLAMAPTSAIALCATSHLHRIPNIDTVIARASHDKRRAALPPVLRTPDQAKWSALEPSLTPSGNGAWYAAPDPKTPGKTLWIRRFDEGLTSKQCEELVRRADELAVLGLHPPILGTIKLPNGELGYAIEPQLSDPSLPPPNAFIVDKQLVSLARAVSELGYGHNARYWLVPAHGTMTPLVIDVAALDPGAVSDPIDVLITHQLKTHGQMLTRLPASAKFRPETARRVLAADPAASALQRPQREGVLGALEHFGGDKLAGLWIIGGNKDATGAEIEARVWVIALQQQGEGGYAWKCVVVRPNGETSNLVERSIDAEGTLTSVSEDSKFADGAPAFNLLTLPSEAVLAVTPDVRRLLNAFLRGGTKPNDLSAAMLELLGLQTAKPTAGASGVFDHISEVKQSLNTLLKVLREVHKELAPLLDSQRMTPREREAGVAKLSLVIDYVSATLQHFRRLFSSFERDPAVNPFIDLLSKCDQMLLKLYTKTIDILEKGKP